MKDTIAPRGKLRAAINLGNAVLTQPYKGSGDPEGITVDLAREFARLMQVGVEFTRYNGAGPVVDDVSKDVWDIGFLAVDPLRANTIAFSQPYVTIEGNFFVRKNTDFTTPDSVDAPGVRIAVAKGAAYDLHLTRALKHAQLVRYPAPEDVAAGVIKDNLEGGAGIHKAVAAIVGNSDAFRLMPAPFMQIHQAVALPASKAAAIGWINGELTKLLASGWVAKRLAHHGQDPAVAAAPKS